MPGTLQGVQRRLAALFFAVFLALAILVDLGKLTRFDQYAVDHWMPWLSPSHEGLVTLRGLTIPRLSWSGALPVDLWTYPAAFVPSAAIVAAVAVVLWRRGCRLDAAVWPALWVAANAVELAGKLIVERPHLYFHGMHVTGFDHSLPSGHTMRAFVVAFALAATWRRARVAVALAAGVPFALVALGAHTPTDVVAGLFAVAALLLVTGEARVHLL